MIGRPSIFIILYVLALVHSSMISAKENEIDADSLNLTEIL